MIGTDLGSVYGKLKLDTTQFNSALAASQGKLAAFSSGAGDKMNKIGTSMMGAGKMMTKHITLPLAAIAVGSIKAFADFDDAMTKSLAIMGDVSDAMKKDMSDAARKVGRTTRYSAKEAADAYFYLASAGLDAKQSIEAMPRVAEFATAGAFDLATATDLLTDAQSALGLSVKDVTQNMRNMERVSDVLVAANTLANATVEQFSESLTTRAGAALKLVNKDIEEGVAVLAAWADQGVKGAEAGTRMDIVLRDLQTRAIQGKDEFKKLGIAVYDSEGNMNSMADIIGDLEGAMSGMSDEQKRATIKMLGFQDRSVAALLSLMGTSDAIREYEKELRSAGGITEEVADKQLQSFSAQMDLLKSEIVDVGIAIGGKLAPSIKKLRDFIQKTIDRFRRLSPEIKDLIFKISLLAAAAGPLLMVLGKIIMSIKAIAGVIAFLASPVALIIAAIVAITAGVIVLVKKWDELSGVGKVLAGVFLAMAAPITGLVTSFKKVAEKIGEFRSKVISSTIEIKDKSLKNIIDARDGIVKIFTEMSIKGGKMSKEMKNKVINNVKLMTDGIIQGLEEKQSDINKSMKELMSGADDVTKGSLAQIRKSLNDDYEQRKKDVRTTHKIINQIIKEEYEKHGEITEAGQQKINELTQGLQDEAVSIYSKSVEEQIGLMERLRGRNAILSAEQAADTVKQSVKAREGAINEANKKFNGIVGWAKQEMETNANFGQKEYDEVVGAARKQRDDSVTAAEERHSGIVSEAQNQAKEHVDEVNWETGEIKSKWEQFKEPLVEKVKEVWRAVEGGTKLILQQLPLKVLKWLWGILVSLDKIRKEVWKKALEIGKKIIRGILNGIGNIGVSIWNKMKLVYLNVINWAKSVWNAGVNLGKNIINGIINGIDRYIPGFKGALGRIAAYIESHSPPTIGPLKEIDKWGLGLGQAYMKGIMRGLTGSISGITSAVPEGINKNTSIELNINGPVSMAQGQDFEATVRELGRRLINAQQGIK